MGDEELTEDARQLAIKALEKALAECKRVRNNKED